MELAHRFIKDGTYLLERIKKKDFNLNYQRQSTKLGEKKKLGDFVTKFLLQ